MLNLDLIDDQRMGYYGLDNKNNIFKGKGLKNISVKTKEEKVEFTVFAITLVTKMTEFKNIDSTIAVFFYEKNGEIHSLFNNIKETKANSKGLCIQGAMSEINRDFRFFKNIINDLNVSYYALAVENEDGTYNILCE